MVRDAANLRLDNQFFQRCAERYVHGNRQGVLHDQQIDLKLGDRLVQLVLDRGGGRPDQAAHLSRTFPAAETFRGDLDDVAMVEVRFVNEEASLRLAVALSRDEVALVTHVFEDFGPLADFEADPVGAENPRGDEPDAPNCGFRILLHRQRLAE